MKKYIFLMAFAALSLHAAQVEGITRPSADVVLSFVRSGTVSSISIVQGQEVIKDQLLVELDNQLESNKISQLQAEIANDTKKLAEEVQLEQKRRDVIDLDKAFQEGAGTKKELDHARVEVKKSEYSILQMDFEKKQLQKKLEEAQILLRQTKLHSPVKGFVEQIFTETGEGIERLKETVRIVQVDPLWIDVPVPMEYANKLKLNSRVEIVFPVANGVKSKQHTAKVIYRAAVADAASETLTFRIEVANPHKRLAGERVKVQLFEDSK